MNLLFGKKKGFHVKSTLAIALAKKFHDIFVKKKWYFRNFHTEELKHENF